MPNPFYNANPNLKSVGVDIPFTAEQVQEYAKCAEDPIYFIKKYIKIVSLDRGLVPFELYEYQERFIRTIHNNRMVISMQSRQMGKCLQLNTKVKLKQKSTGKLVEITLGELYAWQKFKQNGTIEDLQALQAMRDHVLTNAP